MHLCHLLKEPMFCFSEAFKLCEAENINFVEYFVTDNNFFEEIFRKLSLKVSYMSFLIAGIHCILFCSCQSIVRLPNHLQQGNKATRPYWLVIDSLCHGLFISLLLHVFFM